GAVGTGPGLVEAAVGEQGCQLRLGQAQAEAAAVELQLHAPASGDAPGASCPHSEQPSLHALAPSTKCSCFQIGARCLTASITSRQPRKASSRCGLANATTTASSPTASLPLAWATKHFACGPWRAIAAAAASRNTASASG